MNETTPTWDGLPVTERTIDAGGTELRVTEFGSGAPLLLLHGIGSRAVSWLPVAATLGREFRVHALDQRGHGASAKPATGYVLADYARDLDAAIEALGLTRPLVLGHSLGGMVALTWAAAFPDRAAALVIEDSPMRQGGPSAAELFDGWIALSRMTADEATAWYLAKEPGWTPGEARRRAESITNVAPGVWSEMKQAVLKEAGALQTPKYAPIGTPALLLYGDVDQGGMVPEADARAFATALPQADAVRIVGGSHSLHRDAADAFLDLALPFLRTHAAATGPRG